AFAWRYLGAPEFRPRAASDAEPTDHPGVCWTGCSRAGGLQGTARISQVPGKPSGPFALLSDPGRTGYVLRDQGSTYPTRPPHQSTTRAPNGCKFRGSITRLLVSLSTPRGDGLPPLHARLASGCWSQLCRTGFQPAGFLRKVSEHQYSSSSPELSWRELCFGAFRSPPVPCRRLHRPLFSCHWPLFSRHSSLATTFQDPPPWLLPDTDHRIVKIRTGLDLDER